ncbi:MAG TPA: hypothetical protein VH333_06515 [Pseudonocardiaceae bacterium]|nr:hypothetical protein [Pseudonocardiaceae bacterium]
MTVAAQQLGSRIREARERVRPADGSKPTQQWLARQFVPERTPQQISTFEMGRNIPAISILVELYEILHGPLTDRRPDAHEFADWLVDWTIAKSVADAQANSTILSDALRLLENINRRPTGGPVAGPLRSLTDFPGSDPLTVILGDRREPHAKSVADCLIYSASATDAMYLNLLSSHMDHAVIRSDKLLVRMPQDYLESMPEVARSNLLIIGSPAANWGARILNKNDAIFSFRIDDDVVARDEGLRADDRMQDERFATIFGDLVRDARSVDGRNVLGEDQVRARIVDEDEQRLVTGAAALAQQVLAGSTAKAMMNKFRSLGILDPADQEHHAQFTYGSNDFALVTLARNPWSADGRHRAVICGGIHGPGTAWALRELLTQPDRFASRPLGAVLEVKLRLDLDWPTRFDRAAGSFQTREYTAENVLAHLETASTQSPNERSPVFRLMSQESLESRARFVRELLPRHPVDR